jgi:hypothetical protein
MAKTGGPHRLANSSSRRATWLLVVTSGVPSLPIARLDEFRLGLIELSAKHLELAAVRTGYFDAGFIAVDKNPFSVCTAAGAKNVTLAALGIDNT